MKHRWQQRKSRRRRKALRIQRRRPIFNRIVQEIKEMSAEDIRNALRLAFLVTSD